MTAGARKLSIRGLEFTVKLPGPAVLPFLQLYRKLVADEPEGLEEARERASQLPEVVDEILRSCVEGPLDRLEPGDKMVLLAAVGELLASALRPERLVSFREERGG